MEYRVEYVVNSDPSWAIRDLETRVGAWAGQGWQPLGAVSVAAIPNPDWSEAPPVVLAAQAMIKPDPLTSVYSNPFTQEEWKELEESVLDALKKERGIE